LHPTILTVFYPGMENYANEYLENVASQTQKDFRLVIVDDNFSADISDCARSYDLSVEVISSSESPQQNRLRGLEYCYSKGYDCIILSDSDETMYLDRVEKIREFFQSNPGVDVVYNNSIAISAESQFSLNYKEKLQFEDILDFNVLGWGAMNIRHEHIPFILSKKNPAIEVFDWYLALIFLLHHKEVIFLPDVRNYYRAHSDNYVGPVFGIDGRQIMLSLKTKKIIYSEVAAYCHQNGFIDARSKILTRITEIQQISNFINNNSLGDYVKMVQEYFKDAQSVYWWQDVVKLNSLKKIGSET
jgi:hypothetical protein